MSFTEQEVGKIVQDTAQVNKLRKEKAKQNQPLPEYYDGYNQKVAQFDSIRVHSEKDFYPEVLLDKSAPNQTQDERDYIKDIYRQDLTVWLDYVNTTTRFFQDGNWSIDYDDTPRVFGDNTFQNYVESRFIPGTTPRSLESWMKNVLPSIKGRDAEGVVVIRPKELVLNEKGELRSDTLIDPIPIYYDVTAVMNENTEDYILVETDRKSLVTFGNRPERSGLVYELYDKDAIWVIKQTGKKIDLTFSVKLFFQHNWGNVPGIKLMGLPFIFKNREINHSPFLFAVDPLNEVLIDRNNLRLAKANSVYPIKIMLGNECQFSTDKYGEYTTCKDGYLDVFRNDKRERILCESCQGSGLANRTSPQGTILVNPKEFAEDFRSADMVRFVELQGTTLTFLKGEISDNTKEARRMLYLPTNNITTEGQRLTATENVRDDKAQAAFLQLISNQDFDIYQFFIDVISWFRYMEESLAGLVRPQSLDVTTEKDFVEQIGIMHEKGIDPAVLQMKTIQYMKTIYASNEERTKRVKLWVKADRLIGITNETLALKIAQKSVAPWEEYLHCSPFTLMDSIEGIFDKDIDEQVELIQAEAKLKTAEIQTTSRQQLVEETIAGPTANT